MVHVNLFFHILFIHIPIHVFEISMHHNIYIYIYIYIYIIYTSCAVPPAIYTFLLAVALLVEQVMWTIFFKSTGVFNPIY